MKKPIEKIYSCVIGDPSTILHQLETMDQRIYLTKRVSGPRYSFRGVPSSRVDIVVADDVRAPKDPRDIIVLEICRKTGKYSGNVRHRWVLRRLKHHQGAGLPAYSSIPVNETAENLHFEVDMGYSYPRLREQLDGYQVARIVMWHYRRYYSHLSEHEPEVRALADAFDPGDVTLAEANRLASRCLYDLSREMGWRKLTLKEREKLGRVDAAQWQKSERVEEWRHLHSVSQHTLEISNP